MKKLFLALMYHGKGSLDNSLSLLQKHFGPIQSQSEPFDFNFTNYYEEEFGKDLKKVFLVFEKEISKGDLVNIRAQTAEIEEELSANGKRTVNLDPGYLSETELVLATKKYQSFKEDLGNGVYAHKVLEFKDDEVITFSHTFADYRKNKEFFENS